MGEKKFQFISSRVFPVDVDCFRAVESWCAGGLYE